MSVAFSATQKMGRHVTVPATRLLAPDLPSAMAAVFGPDTLRAVHGADTRVGDFAGGTRIFSFSVELDAVPWPLRRLVCGSRLRVTTTQHLTKDDGAGGPPRWKIRNHLKLHCLGAELVRMRPEFSLTREPGGVVLRGGVEHRAALPPPLKGLAERFMCAHSERELRRFEQVLRARGALP